MSSRRDDKKKSSLNAFLPAMGFLMIIALGAVSYVLSAPIQEFLIDNVISDFPAEVEGQYAVAGALFLVLLMLTGMIYAAFAPKPQQRVTEKELKKEKEEAEAERRARKKRQQELRKQAAREREQNGG